MKMEKKYDIIISGAGPAGFCASISAARMGMKVMLIEASDSILGNITAGPLEAIMTFHDENRQVVQGIAEEFVQNCVAEEGCAGHVKDTTGYAETITPFAPEISRYVGFKMLREAGVKLLLQTQIVESHVVNRKIVSVKVFSKAEYCRYDAECFVDCTGDGDLAVMSGCTYELGDKAGKVQPLTSMLQIGGVDTDKLEQMVRMHPEEFCFFSETPVGDILNSAKGQNLHLWGFRTLLKEGYESGNLTLQRGEMHAVTGFYPGEMILNFTRVDADPTDMEERSAGQTEAIMQAYELWKWLRNYDAFRESRIIKIGRIGIREGRRINGYHCISKEELENGGDVRHPAAMGAFPMDIHSPGGTSMEFYPVTKGYQIPMESLISIDIDNLMMAGRCICCTHEAQGSVRITATAMATGQAAGICAALSVKNGKKCIETAYDEVRAELLKQKMVIQ